MKITVTGGSGKLGQFVVRSLVDGGTGREPHEVTVFDQMPGPQHERVRYLAGDVTDLGQVIGASAGADVIVHLAAIPRPIQTTNDVTFRTNVLGTFNVHEAAWRLGIRRVVSTSSVAVLGWDWRDRDFPPEYLPVDEDHPNHPQDAYGLSKVAGEEVARSYTAKCGMETVVLRPGWIVSPEEMQQLHVNGGRQPVRYALFSYIDVRDLAEAYKKAVERSLPGHVAMFLVADDSSVAEPLCDLLPRFMPTVRDMARGLTGTRPDVSNVRAKELLGWQPVRSWRRPETLA